MCLPQQCLLTARGPLSLAEGHLSSTAVTQAMVPSGVFPTPRTKSGNQGAKLEFASSPDSPRAPPGPQAPASQTKGEEGLSEPPPGIFARHTWAM